MATMTADQMDKLAQKLARMRFNRAKGYVRGMDKHSNLELFRVASAPGEWITRYALPEKGLLITLVERKDEFGPASNLGYRKMRFKYLEARVEALPESHDPGQHYGKLPMKKAS